MDNQLQIFNNNEFGEIRVIEQDGVAWFIAKDVCDILEIKNSPQALLRLDDDEKNTICLNDGIRGNPEKSIINESGLYSLVLTSRKPEAKKFKKWVTSEVLPSIRKTGAYQTPIRQMTAAEILAGQAQLLVVMENKVNELESKTHEIEEVIKDKPEFWKKEILTRINTVVKTTGLLDAKIKSFMYAELEKWCKCNLDTRLSKARERAKQAGATYKEQQQIGKIDIIANDKNLKDVFSGIVLQFQRKYNVVNR